MRLWLENIAALSGIVGLFGTLLKFIPEPIGLLTIIPGILAIGLRESRTKKSGGDK